MRKLIILSAALAVVLGGITACGPREQGKSGKPRFAFVTNMPASFWVIAKKGVEKAGNDFGVETSYHMPTGNAAGQKSVLENLLARGVDGIAVSVSDPANQTDILDKIAKKTILVFFVTFFIISETDTLNFFSLAKITFAPTIFAYMRYIKKLNCGTITWSEGFKKS